MTNPGCVCKRWFGYKERYCETCKHGSSYTDCVRYRQKYSADKFF